MNNKRCSLYLITPPKIVLTDFIEKLSQAFDGGEIAALQVRLKDTDKSDICRAIEKIFPIAQSYGTTLIVNDDPRIAKEMGCDGVHIGQSDTCYSNARQIIGADKVVGVTCHDSRHLAMEAGDQGADYVAFGSFYHTSTKQVSFCPEITILNDWSETTLVPCVAIGGIDHENCKPLVLAGADYLAVISAVWDFLEGPQASIAYFHKIISAQLISEVASNFAN